MPFISDVINPPCCYLHHKTFKFYLNRKVNVIQKTLGVFCYLTNLLSVEDRINMEFQNGSMACHLTMQR